jgi:deferrochelatase/peroxidase EfeB
MTERCPFASRRGFLGAAGGLAAAIAAGPVALAADKAAHGISPAGQGAGRSLAEPFFGVHQGGIATALQNHTYFAAFDVDAASKAEVAGLMQRWSEAAARLMAGQTAAPLSSDLTKPAADSGEAIGLGPARLTITFGFGPGLFVRDGKDRFGLAARRPAALADLPRFTGEQLDEARSGGDLSVQACADDPQVAFHAVRQLARIADKTAHLRWVQTGFNANFAAETTPRNLMGFKDGTQNPVVTTAVKQTRTGAVPSRDDFDDVVWVGSEGADWMRGGSYLVVRRIRMALEHWDNSETDFQEQVIGRHKASGAPLGKKSEFDPLDLDAVDADGNPLIADNAHVRLGSAAMNGGAQILRRAYAYNNGVDMIAERWPPWRQGLEYDAGLLFLSYQKDPRTGFTRIFDRMSKLDALNQFTTHVGSGLFAVPPGAAPGGYVGERLFV